MSQFDKYVTLNFSSSSLKFEPLFLLQYLLKRFFHYRSRLRGSYWCQKIVKTSQIRKSTLPLFLKHSHNFEFEKQNTLLTKEIPLWTLIVGHTWAQRKEEARVRRFYVLVLIFYFFLKTLWVILTIILPSP